MLDANTKRRIDTARDILVGKVPDPKSQVEQITIALIYKFMDDMDADAEELGGKRKFFAGEFARYGWAKLIRAGLGGHETLGLYADAITRMPENPGIPPLFRSIFNNAYLPYRDPETLRAFLKVIDEFTYDHSERLGDAFEYLLSVLGSQGDAGQFRTPRHIIDFIVAIIDPKKDETILDPACGTAGFLISAYKRILKANQDKDGNSTLTPDERSKLAANFKGYDISPDMVRLSLVNMYLHGFADPHIFEYDTLTSEDKWNEYADVILANPPFMSPKGGIRPHNRFSIQSKRSEVLFVDYMAEHLTPTGRAGVIVPEGIIFQGQNAYKQLRKMLVDDYLVAVVSLPAGVFNPYSGVKTSILILDKSLAKQTDRIAFFKVENDGYDLGAQRRPIEKNDLPRALAKITEYLHHLRVGKSVAEFQPAPKAGIAEPETKYAENDFQPAPKAGIAEPETKYMVHNFQPTLGLIAEKKIAANGEYNLSGERYRENEVHSKWPIVKLGDSELFRIESGGTPKSKVEEYWDGDIPWITLVDLPPDNLITEINATKRMISDKGLRNSAAKLLPANSVVVSSRATIGRIGINRIPLATNQGFKNIVIADATKAIPEYIALALTNLVPTMQAWASGSTYQEIIKSKFSELQIPLPPLEIQREIAAEIEGYQKVIDGCRQVVENYKPTIDIDPSWEMVGIGALVEFSQLGLVKGLKDHSDTQEEQHQYPYFKMNNITYKGETDFEKLVFVDATEDEVEKFSLKSGDFLFNTRNTPELVGKCCVVDSSESNLLFNNNILRLRFCDKVEPVFVALVLNTDYYKKELIRFVNATTSVAAIYQKNLYSIKIPLPSIDSQRALVDQVENERFLISSSKKLIEIHTQKIQDRISKVWGEGHSQSVREN